MKKIIAIVLILAFTARDVRAQRLSPQGGSITNVIAGTGLVGGGTGGAVTLNITCLTGLTCNADSIGVDTSVVITGTVGTNVLPKGNGFNGLTASSWIDDGTTSTTTGMVAINTNGAPGGLLGPFTLTTNATNDALVVNATGVANTLGGIDAVRGRLAGTWDTTAGALTVDGGLFSAAATKSNVGGGNLTNTGVIGQASATGTGIVNVGVEGIASGTSDESRAGYFLVSGGSSTTSRGVYANVNGATSTNAYGVQAAVTGASTTSYGFYSDVTGGGTNYAWYGAAGVFYQAGAGTFNTTLAVNGLATLTGGFTLGADSSAASHKITNLTNGSSAQDAAAFGQLATAINAAVSGTSGTVPVFTGTNTIGNSDITSSGTLNTIGDVATDGTRVNGSIGVNIAPASGNPEILVTPSDAGSVASMVLQASDGDQFALNSSTTTMSITSTNAITINQSVRVGSAVAPTVALDVTGAALISTTLGVTGLSTLTGGFTLGADSSAGSHKITNLTNGSSAQDAAAFGQIATAVNAAVTGTANTTTKFTGANAVGNAWALDDATTWGVASRFTITEANGNFRSFGTATVDGVSTLTGLVTATAGLTTGNNVTTTGTGDVVSGDGLTVANDVSFGDAVGDVLDVNGDLSKFGTSSGDGATYIYNNTINFGYAVNASTSGGINYNGYANSTTQFRDLIFYDGKQATACTLTGSTKTLNCVGGLQVNGTSVVNFSTNNVVPKGNGTTTVASSITDDASQLASTDATAWLNTAAGSGAIGFLKLGADTTLTTNARNGYTIVTYSDGNIYLDSKTNTSGTTVYRSGAGAEAGSSRTWLTVTNGTAAVAFTGNATVGDATTDSHTVLGGVTEWDTIGTAFTNAGVGIGLTTYDDTAIATGVGGVVNFQGKYTAGGGVADAAQIKAFKTNATDGNYSFDLAFATRPNGSGMTERMRIGDNGRVTIVGAVPGLANGGDLVNSTITATGATISGIEAFRGSLTGTNDTTAGVLSNATANFTNTQTRSAGAFDLTNQGVAGSASGGQINIGGGFSATGNATTNEAETLFITGTTTTSYGSKLTSSGAATTAYGYSATLTNTGTTSYGFYADVSGAGTNYAYYANQGLFQQNADATFLGLIDMNGGYIKTDTIHSHTSPGGGTVSILENLIVGGDLTELGSSGSPNGQIYLYAVTSPNTPSIGFQYENDADATGYVNDKGYHNGTTRFRNLEIRDGKGAAIATFTGTSKLVTFGGSETITGGLTITSNAGELFKYGSSNQIYFDPNNFINFYYDLNSAATGYINPVGYQGGTTQFRNLVIQNGKGADLATFTGSTKGLDIVGPLNGYTQVTKPSDQDVTNSTTLTDDTALTISVTAGKIYAIDAWIVVGGSDTTGDYKGAWAVAAGTMDCTGEVASVTTADAIQNTTVIATAAAATGSTSIGTRADASLPIATRWNLACKVSNTTTLKYQFAENSAVSAKVARTMAGSYIQYKQLN